MKISESRFVVGILANLFLPGLGNVICDQIKPGIIFLATTLMLTFFYFIPLLTFIFPEDIGKVFLSISSALACIVFVIDVALIPASIYVLVKGRK